jgi:hypothetical protein
LSNTQTATTDVKQAEIQGNFMKRIARKKYMRMLTGINK